MPEILRPSPCFVLGHASRAYCRNLREQHDHEDQAEAVDKHRHARKEGNEYRGDRDIARKEALRNRNTYESELANQECTAGEQEPEEPSTRSAADALTEEEAMVIELLDTTATPRSEVNNSE